MKRARDRAGGAGEWWLTAPSFGWLLVCFALPTLLVGVMSVMPAGA